MKENPPPISREKREDKPAGNSPNRVRKYDFINTLVGHRIRMLRQDKGITRSRTAKIVDKSLKRLDDIGSGKESLSAEDIYKLCGFFAVKANFFFIDLAEINQSNGELTINAHQAKELRRLFSSYLNLPTRDMQKSLVHLAESVANSDL